MIDPSSELQLEQAIISALWGPIPAVLGCVRQHTLAPEVGTRNLRGNALLSTIGIRSEIDSPFGPFAIWFRRALPSREMWLLIYRGGKKMPWWQEDALVLAAIVNKFSSLAVHGVAIIAELDSQLSVSYVSSPDENEANLLVQEAVSRWQSKSRLNKSIPRARAVCPHCLVKAKCDQMDMESGQTQDWPNATPPSARS